MADDSRPSLSLARLAAIVAAATSATLGLLKLTGGTMLGAIAMGANKITGLTSGTATGEAITWDALLTTIPRNAYDYSTWTADTPSNVTEALQTGVNGPTIKFTSATASIRGGGRYTAGTRITALLGGSARMTGAAAAGGPMIYVVQASGNRRVGMIVDDTFATGSRVYVQLFTDKDTISTTLLNLHLHPAAQVLGRIESRSGTLTVSISVDGGVNWESIYSAVDATAFGAAGAGTLVGIGAYLGANGIVVQNYAPYALVEA